MAKYRRKIEVVDAIQWTGENWDEVHNWIMQWGLQDPVVRVDARRTIWIDDKEDPDEEQIDVRAGDWLVRKESRFLTYSPKDFALMYEPVPE